MRVVGQQRTWFQPFTPYATHLGSGNKAGIPLVAPPVQQVSTGTLNAGSTSTGTPGTAQSFTVEGASLLGDIVVVGSDNIEVSLSSGSGYGSSVSVSPSGGTVSATTIYARIKSTAPEGSIAETVYATSSGAAGYAIACSGTVTAGGGPAFPSGAIAIWDFEDTLISSPGSYTLTASGGNSYVTGKINTKALQLTAGNTATITTDDFNFIANPCTIAFWAKRAAGGTVDLRYLTSDASWVIALNATDCLVQGDNAENGFAAQDTVTIADDTWAWLCLRFSATAGLTINVNGRAAVTDASATTLGDYTGGQMVLTVASATCAIDQIVIDDRRWTDQEVSDVYNGGSGLSS